MSDHYPFTGPPPAWLPDWRTATYPDHESQVFWAWEFIRRNEKYIADYAHFASLPSTDHDGRLSPKWANPTFWPDADMRFFHGPGGPAKMGETAVQYERRTGAEPIRLQAYLTAKWGLTELPDPSTVPDYLGSCIEVQAPYFLDQCQPERADLGFLQEHYTGQHSRYESREIILTAWPEQLDGSILPVGIDLSRGMEGLEPQFENIRQWLKERDADYEEYIRREIEEFGHSLHSETEDEPAPKPWRLTPRDRIKLPTFLRILDAIWTEGWGKRQEIASFIYREKVTATEDERKSHRDAVDYAKRAGIRLLQTEYIELLKWANYPEKIKKKREE